MSIAVSADPDRLYALVEADPGGGLYRSDDAGKTWTLVNETWTIRARAWYYIKVFADPQNPDVVWVTNAPLLKSIDGGKSFTRVAVPHGDNHHAWIHPDNSDIMINSNDGGANVSYNGGKSWSTQRNQPTAQFYRVNVDHRFPYYVYGGQQDNSTVAIASQTVRQRHRVEGLVLRWRAARALTTAFDRDERPISSTPVATWGRLASGMRGRGPSRNVMAYPTLPAALATTRHEVSVQLERAHRLVPPRREHRSTTRRTSC